MFKSINLYLSWFVFYKEWKSVRLELLTSICLLLILNYQKRIAQDMGFIYANMSVLLGMIFQDVAGYL